MRKALAISLAVLAAALSIAAVAGAHEVSPPFHVGGAPVYNPAAGDQQHPVVAFDGINYLVVWQEKRSNSWDIYGSRVTAEGTVLDTIGIGISSAGSWQESPAVIFDGTNYFVVWEDMRASERDDIYGARVGVDGVVLDPGGIDIASASSWQESPAVAFDGDNYLVVWRDGRGPSDYYDIYGARVSSEGIVLDPDGIPICTSEMTQMNPAAAFDGTGFLVVWEDMRVGHRDIYGARVSVQGVVEDTAGIPITAQPYNEAGPAVASDGTDYFVVWQDGRSGAWDIYGKRVASDGSVIDTSGVAISTEVNNQESLAIAYDGANYVVVWHDRRIATDCNITGARVTPGAVVLDPEGIDISLVERHETSPSVAVGADGLLVVWEMKCYYSQYDLYQYDVYAGRMTLSGEVLDPQGILVTMSANEQSHAAAAFDGTNYLAVWHDDRNGTDLDVCGTRVSVDGVVLDPAGIVISDALGDQGYAAVAFGGDSYLVVWEDYRGGLSNIYGSRVSLDGTVLDSAGIEISVGDSQKYDPAVAFDGTNYLVVWSDNASGSYDICGTRVDADGIVLDSNVICISTAREGQCRPAVVSSTTNYLTVWEDLRHSAGCIWSSDIFGSRVSHLGEVLEGEGIGISAKYGYRFNPAVASDGILYLVVWEEAGEIFGARLICNGVLLDSTAVLISRTPGSKHDPAVVYDGLYYFVVWAASCNIYGSRVNLDGTVLDSLGIPISTMAACERNPAVANGPYCTALIVNSSLTASPYGSWRIWGSIWSGPTSITFASVMGRTEGGYVTLSWQMGVDAPVSSFVIQRSDTPEGEFVAMDIPVLKHGKLSYSCTDYSVIGDRTYWYRIVLVGSGGEEAYGPIEVYVEAVPAAYHVHQSYPNPFNPLCTILYEIPHHVRVSLRVFDVRGSLVRTLVDAHREPGSYSELWDGRAEDGSELPSGVYFYRLEAGEFVATRKMVLLK
ncbi:MAG: hypothetical protein AMJ46_13320 [Latescibacteria bacterium DG_63]|nr:MAG: hypothetical protein AMJ46_13320 [Latescibacteria bacterium DG_63]